MEKRAEYRKVGRALSSEDIKNFESVFSGVPVKDNLQIVKSQAVPVIVSTSEVLNQKTLFTLSASGSLTLGTAIETGHNIIVYREDKEEANKGGFPVNMDFYKLSGGSLWKKEPPFPGHKLRFKEI